jgi:hypothetical protein
MKYNFLKEHVRADRVAQAMSPCLANVKPWVQTSVQPKKKKNK